MTRLTKSNDKRWVLIATLVTFMIHTSLLGLVIGTSVGVISLGTIPQAWFLLYSTVVSAATVWLYGEEVYEVVTSND